MNLKDWIGVKIKGWYADVGPGPKKKTNKGALVRYLYEGKIVRIDQGRLVLQTATGQMYAGPREFTHRHDGRQWRKIRRSAGEASEYRW